jgi:hypothetical protein
MYFYVTTGGLHCTVCKKSSIKNWGYIHCYCTCTLSKMSVPSCGTCYSLSISLCILIMEKLNEVHCIRITTRNKVNSTHCITCNCPTEGTRGIPLYCFHSVFNEKGYIFLFFFLFYCIDLFSLWHNLTRNFSVLITC